ncbi:MAG: hypothetical protein PQJ35_03070 [Sphaerochaetaceae bacterium]|nr:hypothetical protein [Sphaerochaetaceae bacterium]
MVIYSKAGSQQFNAYLDSVLTDLANDVRSAVGDSFIALILAGGYGRGEGACVIRENKESPYNDFDLFLVVKDNYTLSDKVMEVTRSYENILNIEVDIGKPLTVNAIRKLPHQLMWQDLLQSHKVLAGPADILSAHAPSYLKDDLPRVEALRLLLNRGSGLLQAIGHREKMDGDSSYTLPDEDFIRRNREKCTLALGDSLLITHRLYTPPLEQRLERLTESVKSFDIADADRILALYTQAVRFKTEPDSIHRDQPSSEDLKEIASLWISVMLHCESVRTKKSWKDAASYAEDTFIREPQQHTAKNLLRNGLKNIRRKKLSFVYPRERLYRDLTLLLDRADPADQAWNEKSARFLEEWALYN